MVGTTTDKPDARRQRRPKSRPSTYKKRPQGLDRYTCNIALNIVARKVEIMKANNNGSVPHGALNDIVTQMKPTLPWLTKEMLRSHVKKLNKQKTCEPMPPAEGDVFSSTLSPLTIETGMSATSGNNRTSHTASTAHAAGVDSIAATVPGDDADLGLLGGRPKGSTLNNKRDAKERERLATFEAARVYKRTLDQRRNNDKSSSRLMSGDLKTIIANAKAKYKVHDSFTISASTIRSRYKRNNLNPATPQGTPSPMAAVEPYQVEVILQLARMRCPINPTTGLHLANSLIEGTELAKAIVAKRRRKNTASTKDCVSLSLATADTTVTGATTVPASLGTTRLTAEVQNNDERATGTTPMILGPKYWNGFMRRHKHVIRSKRSVKFEAKRAEWCTYYNFSEMYNHIYDAMVSKGIASKVNRKVLLNKEGSIVEHPEDAFGLPTQYLLQRPDKLIFVDEVGSNTSTTKDGHVGGEKFLCEAEGRPQVKAATKDSHFTVLGFTAATGEPVMCAIIFAAQAMCASWVLGLNASATWIGGDKDVRSNSGSLDKRHPQGPFCHINGTTVPTFCCCSENGSITSELLAEMLRVIDRFKVFDRSDGIAPFLLLDGHGSRFELPFLKYINTPETKWNACIGLPYGTSYWQVGDSSEQNGCFKMALTKYKRELLRRKELVGGEFAINKEDITYIVGQAWENSFARIESNKKAIAERGWGPLNFNCLLHPEIVSTRHQGELSGGGNGGHQQDIRTAPMPQILDPEDQDRSENEQLQLEGTPPELNVSQGLAGSLIGTILEKMIRDDARNGVNREENRQKQIQTALEVINAKKKRLSAGLHVAAQRYLLGPDVLDDQEARQQQQENKVSERLEKKLQEFRSLKCKVAAIRKLNKDAEQMTVVQLKTMVTWHKCAGDLPIPSTRPLLLQRLQTTVIRGDPKEPELPAAHHIQPPATDTPAVVTVAPAPEWEMADEPEDSGAAGVMLCSN